jgi:hypothetical protein
MSVDGLHWTDSGLVVTNGSLNAVAKADGGFIAVGFIIDHSPVWFPLSAMSSDGLTWTLHSITSFRERLIGVARGNGVYAAISAAGVWTSPDGVTWANVYAISNRPAQSALSAITYGSGRFVAVGTGIAVTSTDTNSWVPHATGTDETMNSVAFGQNLFVAVGHGGTLFSSTDGATWISAGGVTNQVIWNGVNYGNGRFVAVGFDDSTSVVLTSTNGLSWSNANHPTTSTINTVAFGEDKFVAVGAPGVVLTSSDGESWTNQGSPNYEVEGVAYGKGTFVATAFERVLTSQDGTAWTSHQVTVPPKLGYVAFTGERFFALSKGIQYNADAVNGVSTSIDGTNWERSMVWTNGSTTVDVSLPTHGRSVYVAVGNSYDSVAKVFLAHSFVSADGLSWTKHKVNTRDSLLQVAYANGQFVVVGWTGYQSVEIFTSVDGASWNLITSAVSDYPWGSLAVGNGSFVTATMGGFLVCDNGGPWRAVKPGFDQLIYDVSYGDGMFVASGAAGFVLTSETGNSWKLQNIGTQNWLWRCAYANDTFIAASGGALYQSASPVFPGFRLDPPHILPSGAVQIPIHGIIGQNWETQTSTDLQNWTPIATGISTNSSTECLDTNACSVGHRFYRTVLR